jgi:hypothetical protein
MSTEANARVQVRPAIEAVAQQAMGLLLHRLRRLEERTARPSHLGRDVRAGLC